MRNANQRGSVAVELGLALPVFILVVCGGIQLGRALVTKHNLEAAVAVVTRQAAIANQRSSTVIADGVRARLGGEAIACDTINTQAVVIKSTVVGSPDALQVTSTCQLAPMFNGLLKFTPVDHVTAVVAMPLPI